MGFVVVKGFLTAMKKEWKARKPGSRKATNVSQTYQQNPAIAAEDCLSPITERKGILPRPPTYVPSGFPQHEELTNTSNGLMEGSKSGVISEEERGSLATKDDRAGSAVSLQLPPVQESRIEKTLEFESDVPSSFPETTKEWVSAHKGRFTQETSRVLSVGDEDLVSFRLNRQLLLMIIDSVRHQRDFVKTMGPVDKDLSQAEVKLEELSAKIEQLQQNPDQDRTASDSKNLVRTLKSREDLSQSHRKLEELMSEKAMEQCNHTFEMFELLDSMLVDSMILDPIPDPVACGAIRGSELGDSPAPTATPIADTRNETYISASNPTSRYGRGTGKIAKEKRLLRKDLRNEMEAVEVNPPGHVVPARRDQRPDTEELLYNFNMSKTAFEIAMQNLHNRHERFEHEARERAHRATEGKEIESQDVVDMQEFQTTRLMTQNVQRTEAKFEAAKAAIIAAGLQPPGSDVASGFVSESDDGYRLSRESEDSIFVAVPGVLSWLDIQPMQLLSPLQDGQSETPAPDVDTWDAASVGMCDSCSMVAEGSEKRRIEKWKGMCNLKT